MVLAIGTGLRDFLMRTRGIHASGCVPPQAGACKTRRSRPRSRIKKSPTLCLLLKSNRYPQCINRIHNCSREKYCGIGIHSYSPLDSKKSNEPQVQSHSSHQSSISSESADPNSHVRNEKAIFIQIFPDCDAQAPNGAVHEFNHFVAIPKSHPSDSTRIGIQTAKVK